MFNHLKAEDFINLMEGCELPARYRSHIDSCARCRATWESVQAMHAEVSSTDTDIPEPDWNRFRSSVRDELLSRSVQRDSAVRRWTGWSIRPAAAWALSVLLVAGITIVTVLWQTQQPPVLGPSDQVSENVSDPPGEVIEAGPEKSLFDEVVSLGEEQQEQFRQILLSTERGKTNQR